MTDGSEKETAGSGIALATGRAGEWGSRFAESALVGRWSKLGEPLILGAGVAAWHNRAS